MKFDVETDSILTIALNWISFYLKQINIGKCGS